MITFTIGCILAGCLQDVPVYVGSHPVRYYLSTQFKPSVDRSEFSCYVNGEFYESCPN